MITPDMTMIEAAAERMRGHGVRTPLLSSPLLDDIAGRQVLVKAECLQRTGSFKFRGAWSAISALPSALRARGVLAYSSGNHAQAIAYAAREFGIVAVIVMPSDAPAAKIKNTRAYGAEVVTYERGVENREAVGEALAEARGLTLIRPYDDPYVIAGQGTIGLEIAEDAAVLGIESATVLTCCGGGGMTAGIALALETRAPKMVVRPVEPHGFDDTARSLVAGERVANPNETGSICDAIVTPTPGELTFPVMQRLCGAGVVVRDETTMRAMALAFMHLKIVVEPGGAVALAAAVSHGAELADGPVIAIASGGNADPAMLTRALKYQ